MTCHLSYAQSFGVWLALACAFKTPSRKQTHTRARTFCAWCPHACVCLFYYSSHINLLINLFIHISPCSRAYHIEHLSRTPLSACVNELSCLLFAECSLVIRRRGECGWGGGGTSTTNHTRLIALVPCHTHKRARLLARSSLSQYSTPGPMNCAEFAQL